MNRQRVITRMRLLREQQGISQATLAGKMGVAQSKVSSWESLAIPMPDPRRRQAAAILGCAPDELLSPISGQ